jgi:type II secretory ATPase GspE/PulE/Tfp pilus assembly ATPase PilB-like protein/GAF domain-containing protein
MAFFSKLMRSGKPRHPGIRQDFGDGSQDPNSTSEDYSSLNEQDLSSIDDELAFILERKEPRNSDLIQSDDSGKDVSGAQSTAQQEPRRQQNSSEGRRSGDLVKPLINKVLSAPSIKAIFPSLIDDLNRFFNCQTVILYSIDSVNKHLSSHTLPNAEVDDFRLEISPKSFAGYCAITGKTLKIANAYSAEELKQHVPELSHNTSWDKLSQSKTSSALVVTLHFEKQPVGVLELLNKEGGEKFSDADERQAKELANTLGNALVRLDIEQIEEKVQSIGHAIHSAKNLDSILLDLSLKCSLLDIFGAELVTLYAIDLTKNEIYSKIKSGTSFKEIRLPLSNKIISGCVAREKKPFNIGDVNNSNELKNYHPELTFDKSLDKKSGIKTKSMLVYPLIYNNKTLGVLQLSNKRVGERFTSFDQKNALVIADHLALAFNNQRLSTRKKRNKYAYLLENGIITQDELNNAISQARKTRTDIEAILLGEFKLKRKDIGKSLENFYEIPYTGYDTSISIPQQLFSGLNKNFLAKNHWVPIQLSATNLTILIDDPLNQDKISNIKMIFPKKHIDFNIGLRADIQDFLNMGLTETSIPEEPEGDGPQTEELSTLLDALTDERAETAVDIGNTVDESVDAISETDSTIVRLVNKVLIDAFDQGVSDIHIEPGVGKKDVRVRYRKDGTCRVYQRIPYMYKQAIVSRIKIMSRLDIAEKRLPQDGKIKMRYGRKEIEFRVATCPTVGGNEDVVLRILASSKPIPLDKMNFSKQNLNWIYEMVAKPYGLILVVGPTGSGKTTTLHSCLGHINNEERKIWTAEDPVEITQEGLRQVQMLDKIGLNFAKAMRSFLRGDPDVIMVGEMRDSETASIGLEASLTGHLVLSTLHTNSAPETITRLLDMGMNPLNFADALLLIAAQRLVKTLCKECKEEYQPSKEEFETIVQEYGEKDFAHLGIKYTKDLKLQKPVGCPSCMDTGYAGRLAIHEVLFATPEIKQKIMHKSLVDELRELAKQQGMRTLKQDGIEKIFQGRCDLKQVLTVSSV